MKAWIKRLKKECDDARTAKGDIVGQVGDISRLIAEIERTEKENEELREITDILTKIDMERLEYCVSKQESKELLELIVELKQVLKCAGGCYGCNEAHLCE